ncbi:MAG TPA: ATP-binding protein [Actinomycetota bacterium]|nr:ATP-binding protein [Actinomycetota bacterium]
MRPLDRLPSIRAKLGSVIVFAVAVTILIMYVAVGFAFRQYERDRRFRELLIRTRTISALGFDAAGRPSAPLLAAIKRVSNRNRVVVVDAMGNRLVGHLPVPSTVARALGGQVDTGEMADQEYIGVPVIRDGVAIGATYLAQPVEGSGIAGAIAGTARFVRTVWWELLVAGATAAFIALALARFLARGMTQPLRDMAEAARGMARGDYRQRVHTASRDEVGRLAEAFNRMAGEMEGVERLRHDLVANVSHELKTPISALRARLENLLDGVEKPTPEILAVMLNQSERLSRLVDQLLDLSQLESGAVPLAREPVELAPLVQRVAGDVRVSRPERTVEVRSEVPLDLPRVDADPERLHQVLFNLLDNAYRFTPSGGVVTVRAARDNGALRVSVLDTGPGIPEEHLPLVFERFYRADPSRSREDGGTGIGLAIARSVVEAHGGKIWAESTVGRGSTFSFVLPANEAEPAIAEGGG